LGDTGAYDLGVDTFLAIASKRDTRSYASRPIPDDVVGRILEAGRIAGSARNRQPWELVIVESPDALGRLADAVYAGDNVRGATLVVAILGRAGMDIGRCAQNMMLAAWNDGVASCPNGLQAPEDAQRALGLDADEEIAIVLTFGYPARERDPLRRTPEEWLARADRKPLHDLTRKA
jgi:nitroreductase